MRVDTEHMVSAGRSFLDVVDHARSMEHIHREAQGSSDKRARYQGSYTNMIKSKNEKYIPDGMTIVLKAPCSLHLQAHIKEDHPDNHLVSPI